MHITGPEEAQARGCETQPSPACSGLPFIPLPFFPGPQSAFLLQGQLRNHKEMGGGSPEAGKGEKREWEKKGTERERYQNKTGREEGRERSGVQKELTVPQGFKHSSPEGSH